jgi:hypothetical protein
MAQKATYMQLTSLTHRSRSSESIVCLHFRHDAMAWVVVQCKMYHSVVALRWGADERIYHLSRDCVVLQEKTVGSTGRTGCVGPNVPA